MLQQGIKCYSIVKQQQQQQHSQKNSPNAYLVKTIS